MIGQPLIPPDPLDLARDEAVDRMIDTASDKADELAALRRENQELRSLVDLNSHQPCCQRWMQPDGSFGEQQNFDHPCTCALGPAVSDGDGDGGTRIKIDTIMFEDVSKYPLCWPDNWPRAPFRHTSKFGDRTVAQAWAFLSAEMRRLSGAKSWFMSSNIPRTQKGEGAPRSDIGMLKDPGVAVYFTIKEKPVSLACDKWNHVQDNMWAIAKHIEALRGQERWGVGTMEQAFRGYMALPGLGETGGLSWWKVLGVPINATHDQTRHAYLALVKKHHPDYLGDPEQFAIVQQAWEQFERTQRVS